MWSAVDQTLLGLRGFPYHLELISGPFFFFFFLILEICWIFQNFSNFFEFTLGKNKKSHVFPIFLAEEQQKKHWLGSDEKHNWPVCCMVAAFSKEPTYWIVEVQVQIPSNSRSWSGKTSVLTCLCVQSLSKKLGSFFCLRAHPLGTQEESEKAPHLMPILKVSLWENPYKDFFIWIFHCRVNGKHSKERENIQWQHGLCSLYHASCNFWHFSHGLFRSYV